MLESRKVALVTNFTDYAGPPAVRALLDANFRVLVSDPGGAKEEMLRNLSTTYPDA